jgi:hypothetical protein
MWYKSLDTTNANDGKWFVEKGYTYDEDGLSDRPVPELPAELWVHIIKQVIINWLNKPVTGGDMYHEARRFIASTHIDRCNKTPLHEFTHFRIMSILRMFYALKTL